MQDKLHIECVVILQNLKAVVCPALVFISLSQYAIDYLMDSVPESVSCITTNSFLGHLLLSVSYAHAKTEFTLGNSASRVLVAATSELYNIQYLFVKIT